eukprot:1159387-Pelagomonas_calceolata.AAC.2
MGVRAQTLCTPLRISPARTRVVLWWAVVLRPSLHPHPLYAVGLIGLHPLHQPFRGPAQPFPAAAAAAAAAGHCLLLQAQSAWPSWHFPPHARQR